MEFLYEDVLVKSHPNAFSVTPEAEFLTGKAEIEGQLETVSETEFLLDLMRLTALAGDSHTMVSVGNGAAFRAYPFVMTRRGTSWYLSDAAPEDEDLLCKEVALLAGKPVEEVIAAYGTLFASDNPAHLRRQFRQACNVADIYECLGLMEAGEPLIVTMKDCSTLSLEPMDMAAMNELAGLIGESTFSSAVIDAVELQEMGGVLAGEDAGAGRGVEALAAVFLSRAAESFADKLK